MIETPTLLSSDIIAEKTVTDIEDLFRFRFFVLLNKTMDPLH